jgi:predicted transposase YdaD
MRHDQLFKTVIGNLLREFLDLFYPEVAARLNFSTTRLLDKELFAEVPEGLKREADLVAEIQTHAGEPELVLIHVEIQARTEPDVPRRMFHYYALLSLRYAKPAFPIVVYLRGGEGIAEEEYKLALFGREHLRFRYGALGLERLPASEYAGKGPLGSALGALMDKSAVDDIVQFKASMLKEILESELDLELKGLLLNVVETYFELDEQQMDELRRLLATEEYRDMIDTDMTYFDKLEERGRQKGREEGREEGREAGKRETLLRLLTSKFGPLPEGVVLRVNALESGSDLDDCLERLLTARSLGELGLESPGSHQR